MRTAAEGFVLLPLASPQEITEPKAFLKEAIICSMFGMFPEVDRMTPTCLAVLENSTFRPSILIGFKGIYPVAALAG